MRDPGSMEAEVPIWAWSERQRRVMAVCGRGRDMGQARAQPRAMAVWWATAASQCCPLVVFDRGSMPCKAATDNERHRYGD